MGKISAAATTGTGLEEVVISTSKICFIDGVNGKLLYRGYDVLELAEKSSFEEVAYLLWYHCLPRPTEFQAFLDGFSGSLDLPIETIMILRMFPKAATPMEVLRTAVSSLGHWDPDSGNTRLDACLRKAQRITERIPLLISAMQRLRSGHEPVKPIDNQSIAYNFLYTLHNREPEPTLVKAFDSALILHADHELNASTFAARVTASTMADLYSSVTSAIGTLKGPLHGGANIEVMRALKEIEKTEKVESWVRQRLQDKKKIPGFGHRVYRCEDPRVAPLRQHARQCAELVGNLHFYELTRALEKTVTGITGLFPNVDLYSASLYHTMEIPEELFTPIFAMSRVVGWTSHIFEQWRQNRLIRPRAEYVGPTSLGYVPILERDSKTDH
ncbi:MAG: citrate synthase [Deltaproteobacteria bacterium]|nr:citrate synthase [Deltaproteobacteria bacterium]